MLYYKDCDKIRSASIDAFFWSCEESFCIFGILLNDFCIFFFMAFIWLLVKCFFEDQGHAISAIVFIR